MIVRRAGDPGAAFAGGKGKSLLRLEAHADIIPRFVVVVDGDACAEDLVAQLERECAGFGERLAVRSSANVEDSDQHNYSGLFRTVLGVPRTHLADALRDVLDSTRSERVSSYSEHLGITQDTIHMSVIVQEMVASRVAGVAMTLDGTEGAAVCIEAVFGLGEALVSGREAGDRYLLAETGPEVLDCKVRPQGVMCVMCPHGAGTEYVPLPFFQRNRQKLTSSQAVAVRDLIVGLSRDAQGPVVVEFAFDERQLWLLQCRPLAVAVRGAERT